MALKITLTWFVISLVWAALAVMIVDSKSKSWAAILGGAAMISTVVAGVASIVAGIWILPIP